MGIGNTSCSNARNHLSLVDENSGRFYINGKTYFRKEMRAFLWHLYNPWAPSLLVHHAVLLVCFTLALYREVTINYLILTLFCELHSIFLHSRRVLRMAGVRKEGSWPVKIEWSFNWITFLTSRIAMHVLITCKLIKDICIKLSERRGVPGGRKQRLLKSKELTDTTVFRVNDVKNSKKNVVIIDDGDDEEEVQDGGEGPIDGCGGH
ncbi:hypothetical protein GOP47_0024831 [Adiantum capillus-veneris]|uniref:TLC domain-containing protein n=1 Tax=Adiantum capillus-veneris TaxID=13818 RepID=A0A9D4U2H7_ADICA|nr:hypothetical protein GOP47_0024831 [Adiantum capillus-veneris]